MSYHVSEIDVGGGLLSHTRKWIMVDKLKNGLLNQIPINRAFKWKAIYLAQQEKWHRVPPMEYAETIDKCI